MLMGFPRVSQLSQRRGESKKNRFYTHASTHNDDPFSAADKDRRWQIWKNKYNNLEVSDEEEQC